MIFISLMLIISCFSNSVNCLADPSIPLTPRVSRSSLFHEIFGCTEEAFKADYARCLKRDNPDQIPLIRYALDQGELVVSPTAGLFKDQPIRCGNFAQFTLDDLIKRTNALKPAQEKGRFNVVEGVRTTFNSSFRARVDVAALQADTANRDAVFQVASNFNALETVDADQLLDEQLLGDYIYDLTQGSAASLSALGGLLYRRYFLFYPQSPWAPSWEQTAEKQVNFLSALADVVPVTRAGYVQFTTVSSLPTLEQYKAITIGFHENIQVTTGMQVGPDEQVLVGNQEQLINQVFTAAVDLKNTNRLLSTNPNVKAWARTLLRAGYEGTLRATAMKCKKKLFLTLVGGGVFGNQLSWIGDALLSLKQVISDSGITVNLIWYSSKGPAFDDKFRKQLFYLVQQTGGTYEQLRDEKPIISR